MCCANPNPASAATTASDSNVNAYSNTYIEPDADAYIEPDSNSNAYSTAEGAYSDAHTFTNANTNSPADSYSNSNAGSKMLWLVLVFGSMPFGFEVPEF